MRRLENQEVEKEVRVLRKFLNQKLLINMFLKNEIFMILLMLKKYNKKKFNNQKNLNDQKRVKNWDYIRKEVELKVFQNDLLLKRSEI